MKITFENCSGLIFPNFSDLNLNENNDENEENENYEENENENENENESNKGSFKNEEKNYTKYMDFRNFENSVNSPNTKFTQGDGTVKSADWSRNGETDKNGKSSQYQKDENKNRNSGKTVEILDNRKCFNLVLMGKKVGNFWNAVSTPVRYSLPETLPLSLPFSSSQKTINSVPVSSKSKKIQTLSLPSQKEVEKIGKYGSTHSSEKNSTVKTFKKTEIGSLNFLNLDEKNGKYRWLPVLLKLNQKIIFEIHNISNGMIVATSQINFNEIKKLNFDEDGFTKTEIIFEISNNYGGGQIYGNLTFLVEYFDVEKERILYDGSVYKNENYWDLHRNENWKNYPIAPISTGESR